MGRHISNKVVGECVSYNGKEVNHASSMYVFWCWINFSVVPNIVITIFWIPKLTLASKFSTLLDHCQIIWPKFHLPFAISCFPRSMPNHLTHQFLLVSQFTFLLGPCQIIWPILIPSCFTIDYYSGSLPNHLNIHTSAYMNIHIWSSFLEFGLKS